MKQGRQVDSGTIGSDSSHHGRFLPGTIVAGRYRIVSLLGKGGMGEVYRADDLKLGHTVALKFLPGNLESDPKRLDLFHQEVRLARQISHPNVCRVYDIVEVDGQNFLSMEFIDGEDLKSLLKRIGRIPVDKANQIAQQICLGLAAAHGQGVLHRDLKPANIMIDGKGQARIMDFGLAKLVDDAGQGEIAGTPAYMAPEQLCGGRLTVQTDLFALALVYCEMLTGRRPLGTGSVAELRQAHGDMAETAILSTLEDLAPDTAELVSQCLESDPTDRPASAYALASAFPGGDPLAAAMAAGQTPTPEMVAGAGTKVGLSTRQSMFCLLFILGGLILAVVLAGRTYLVRQTEVKHPALLRQQAQSLLDQLNYNVMSGQDFDSAWGFSGGGQDRDEARPFFWYRRSPERGSLAVREFVGEFESELLGAFGRTTLDTPTFGNRGEQGLSLSADGSRLRWFRVVASKLPVQNGSSSQNSEWRTTIKTTLENSFPLTMVRAWQPIDSASGNDSKQLSGRREKISPSSPRLPGPYDHHALFVYAEDENEFFFAATLDGKLVYFGPIEELEEISDDDAGRKLTLADYVELVQANAWNVYLLGLTAISCVLAIRNIQLGRIDRRTATRVAITIFVICFAIWLITAHHAPWTSEFNVFRLGVASAMLNAGFFLMWYVAVEPLIRRIWPDCLVTWVRFASGRFSDPVVGRDFLFGVMAGLICNLILHITTLLAQPSGDADPYTWPCWYMNSLSSHTTAIAAVLSWLVRGTFICSCLLALLVLLRSLLKWELLAGFVMVAFLCLVLVRKDSWAVDLAREGLVWSLLTYVTIRYGFLPFMVAWFSLMLLNHSPLTFDTNLPYFPHAAIHLSVFLGMALYGFYVTIGGRRGLRQLGLLAQR